jgi:DNA polymerase III subunit epsilon
MQLSKPIVFFDLETTGVNTASDRIVQIGAVKIMPDGSREEKNVLINPTIPIPASASAIHGISNEAVQGAPVFRQIAKSFAQWLSGCDLAGYNSDNFDVPMLVEEFARAGIDFPEEGTRLIDVLKIERNVNSHRLEESYKRYTGQSLDGAHDALSDIRATVTIFEKQLERHPNLPASIPELEELCQGENSRIDFAGKLYEKNGQAYWAFGKHKDQAVSETRDYAEWALRQDFPSDTKKHLRRILGLLASGGQ